MNGAYISLSLLSVFSLIIFLIILFIKYLLNN